jgi:hypothetical protein
MSDNLAHDVETQRMLCAAAGCVKNVPKMEDFQKLEAAIGRNHNMIFTILVAMLPICLGAIGVLIWAYINLSAKLTAAGVTQ